MSGTWLLPAQTLLDLVSQAPTTAKNWADSSALSECRTSVLSVAHAYAKIEELSGTSVRKSSRAVLGTLLAFIAREANVEPLGFESRHAVVWERLIYEPTLATLRQVDRMIYATAAAEGLAVVERARPETIALQQLNIDLVVI